MRSFFASFFGTLAALAVLVGAAALGLAVLVSGLTTYKAAPAAIEKGSWLVLDLSDNFQDSPVRDDGLEQIARALDERSGGVLQSRRVTRAIDAAAADEDIAGLYLSGLEPSVGSSGFAALTEIRDAISRFRASGKPVRTWLTWAGTREYYLASAAGEVAIDPFGGILLPGLATQPVFFARSFEKFGIGVQVTRVGKYKSAVEPFTRTDMSPESRAQTQKLLDDLWGDLARAVEESRGLAPGALQQVVDRDGLIRPEFAKEAGLVDRVAYADEVLDELREQAGEKTPKKSFPQVTIENYARLVPSANLAARRRSEAAEPMPSGHEKIAIVYAEGAIVDGRGTDQGMVWAANVARDLREIRRDTSVKALVLRVNSPGGSVSASEQIQREIRLIGKQKPVAVSMGSMAASGGYWISTYADRIWAEPTTITGSIGVFGLLFNVEQLATGTLGLSFETVKTGRFADASTITRPKTPEELALIQKNVDWIYAQFLSKVSESRSLEPAAVEEIAQGRVWSGAEAKRLGLVDEIGGLDAAVAWAAAKASVGEEFAVVEYPRRRRLVDALTEMLERGKPEESALSGTLVRRVLGGLKTLDEFNDPQGIYARLPFEMALR